MLAAPLLVVLGLIFQVSGAAFAATWTNQQDYTPGSTVTISATRLGSTTGA